MATNDGGSKLTPAQIAGVAEKAGFKGRGLVIAVAVAMAESGGNPRAHNPVPPDDSYGLWQINMLGAMGTVRRTQYGLASNADLFDPAKNAKAAYSISAGGVNWVPWSTYTNGAYKQFMTAAETGAAAPVQNVSADNASLGSGTGFNLLGIFIEEQIKKYVITVISFVGGGLLLLLGVTLLVNKYSGVMLSQSPVGKIAGQVKRVVGK